MENLAECIAGKLRPHCRRIEIAGSIRRKKPNPSDIDIVLIPKNQDEVEKVIYKLDSRVRGGDKMISVIVSGIQVDFYFATYENWGAMMLTYTGPSGANIGMRRMAKDKGYKLNQYGLWDAITGDLVASRTEEEIYSKLGKNYNPPELRGLTAKQKRDMLVEFGKKIWIPKKESKKLGKALQEKKKPAKKKAPPKKAR